MEDLFLKAAVVFNLFAFPTDYGASSTSIHSTASPVPVRSA